MIKRTLYFGNPAYLSLKENQLVIRLPEVVTNNTVTETFKKEAQATIPIEDIGIVVLDHLQITLTHGVLNAMQQNNVAVISCDATHHPMGLMLPLNGNTLQNERYRAQLEVTEPLKKQLWAITVTQKIKNQAHVLKINGLDNSYLINLSRNVKSGDSDGAEATAAAHYWSKIFTAQPLQGFETLEGVTFKRDRNGLPPNNYLNYGYSLLRATMARSIVVAGLLPTLGIHHANRYNAYCLADDLMEPYRPWVDGVVIKIIKEHGLQNGLTKEIKTILLGIPVLDVMLDGETSPLMNAMQRTAVSIYKCYTGEIRKPLYPSFDTTKQQPLQGF